MYHLHQANIFLEFFSLMQILFLQESLSQLNRVYLKFYEHECLLGLQEFHMHKLVHSLQFFFQPLVIQLIFLNYQEPFLCILNQ